MDYNTTKDKKKQVPKISLELIKELSHKKKEVTEPKTKEDIIEKFSEKKKKSKMTWRFQEKFVKPKTLLRIRKCGSFLQFVTDKGVTRLKLHRADFCKNPFCPMCVWRKAKRDAVMLSTCLMYIKAEHKKSFVFLTLTAPNVKGENLSQEITRYNKAFKNLMQRKAVLGMNKGYVRKLEITYNEKRNDFHPHFHVLIAVNSSYFTDKNYYISQPQWLELWRSVMNDTTIMQVDVRKMKFDKNKDVLEMAKYSAKDSEVFHSQEVFNVFYGALYGRQKLTYNGLFKDAVQLYKSGELDKYKEIDETKYFYSLMCNWVCDQYVFDSLRELTVEERANINKKSIEDCEVDSDG